MHFPISQPNAPNRRRWRTLFSYAVPLAVLLGLFLNYFASRPPAWWQQVGRDAQPYSGESVENRLLKEATLVRTMTDGVSGPWSVRITQEEANAWLRERLPAWIAHGALDTPLARQCKNPRLAFRPGNVIAGMQRGKAVLSGALSPKIREGCVWIEVRSLHFGSLPMPQRVLSRFADDATVLKGQRSAAKARIELDDGRVIEVLGIDVGTGWVELRARTRLKGQ